jgi:hypothetical protein
MIAPAPTVTPSSCHAGPALSRGDEVDAAAPVTCPHEDGLVVRQPVPALLLGV